VIRISQQVTQLPDCYDDDDDSNNNNNNNNNPRNKRPLPKVSKHRLSLGLCITVTSSFILDLTRVLNKYYHHFNETCVS
jgi:hypothetical protein